MSRRPWSARRRYRFKRTILAVLTVYMSVNLWGEANAPLPRFQEQGSDVIDLVGGSWQRTRASWTNTRPRYCYDRGKRTRVPNVSMWTAHKTLPCGTLLEVRRNGRLVRVRVWDRGPYVDGRALDLSKAAFAKLDDPRYGVVVVWWRRA